VKREWGVKHTIHAVSLLPELPWDVLACLRATRDALPKDARDERAAARAPCVLRRCAKRKLMVDVVEEVMEGWYRCEDRGQTS
jgi:hypothetical protein